MVITIDNRLWVSKQVYLQASLRKMSNPYLLLSIVFLNALYGKSTKADVMMLPH